MLLVSLINGVSTEGDSWSMERSSDVTKLVKIHIRRMRIQTYKYVRMRIRMRIPLYRPIKRENRK